MSGEYRIEHDTMGELRVPADALWGAQTQRAVENFRISGTRLPPGFIRALGLIKAAAADTNVELGELPGEIGAAIVGAAERIAAGELYDQFPVDVFQTGSGTSTNMNANEVIAHLAGEAGGPPVHPNDHVNCGQSSNDVIPTAIHVSAALAVEQSLLPALAHLEATILAKAATVAAVVKTGRTHLMDAMPLSFAQELGGWAAQVAQDRARIEAVRPRLRQLAQGGTAVGTGINTHPGFRERFARHLSDRSGVEFVPSENTFASLAGQETAVELSGQLKTLAVTLTKISNDLRWMNSGPNAGLAEIRLPELQPGSSIMPGKVNPVIPEAVAMVAAQVIGNDAAITIAGQSGNFQLNVMLPLIATNLLSSLELLHNAAQALADLAIRDLAVNEAALARQVSRNPVLVTALNTVIGYEKGAEIAKTAYREGRPVIDVAAELTDLGRDELERLLDPGNMLGPEG